MSEATDTIKDPRAIHVAGCLCQGFGRVAVRWSEAIFSCALVPIGPAQSKPSTSFRTSASVVQASSFSFQSWGKFFWVISRC